MMVPWFHGRTSPALRDVPANDQSRIKGCHSVARNLSHDGVLLVDSLVYDGQQTNGQLPTLLREDSVTEMLITTWPD